MREFFKSTRFKILAAIVVILFGFMMYQVSVNGATAVTSSVFSFITAPFQSMSAKISSSFSSFLSDLVTAEKRGEENETLKQENLSLKQQLLDLERYKRENEQYKQALGIQEDHTDFEVMPAFVMSRDPSSAFSSFIIDKGSLHGVSLQDPVITTAGLVGYISEVGPTYSRVSTVLNPATSVGAIDSRTRDTGTVKGTLDLSIKGKSRLFYIPRDSEMKEGDTIITSGTGGVYPKGLVIGTVEEIGLDSGGISKYAVIAPPDDISSIQDVFVITSFAYQGIGLDLEPEQPSDNASSNASSQSSSSSQSSK